MKKIKFGGDEPLAKCGKNSVTGLVIVWDVDKKVRPRKPDPKKYPGLGSGWLSGFKHNKTLKKLKARIKAAKEKWNKQERDWKAARKKALKDVEDQAKNDVRKIAKEHAKEKIAAKSCTHPECKKKEWDGDVDLNVKSDAFSVSDNKVKAWAVCIWTATPLCKKEGEAEKKEKEHIERCDLLRQFTPIPAGDWLCLPVASVGVAFGVDAMVGHFGRYVVVDVEFIHRWCPSSVRRPGDRWTCSVNSENSAKPDQPPSFAVGRDIEDVPFFGMETLGPRHRSVRPLALGYAQVDTVSRRLLADVDAGELLERHPRIVNCGVNVRDIESYDHGCHLSKSSLVRWVGWSVGQSFPVSLSVVGSLLVGRDVSVSVAVVAQLGTARARFDVCDEPAVLPVWEQFESVTQAFGADDGALLCSSGSAGSPGASKYR